MRRSEKQGSPRPLRNRRRTWTAVRILLLNPPDSKLRSFASTGQLGASSSLWRWIDRYELCARYLYHLGLPRSRFRLVQTFTNMRSATFLRTINSPFSYLILVVTVRTRQVLSCYRFTLTWLLTLTVYVVDVTRVLERPATQNQSAKVAIWRVPCVVGGQGCNIWLRAVPSLTFAARKHVISSLTGSREPPVCWNEDGSEISTEHEFQLSELLFCGHKTVNGWLF